MIDALKGLQPTRTQLNLYFFLRPFRENTFPIEHGSCEVEQPKINDDIDDREDNDREGGQ